MAENAKLFYQKSWEGCIKEAMNQLESGMYQTVASLSFELYWSKEPLPFDRKTEGVKRAISLGETWGDLFDCGWFHFTGTVPQNTAIEDLVARIDLSGEGLMFDRQGTPVIGLTNAHCLFDPYWGTSAKREIPLKYCTEDGQTVDFWVDAGCNDIVGGYADSGKIMMAEIDEVKETAIGLYYDFEVLLDLYHTMDANSARARRLFEIMKTAVSVLDTYADDELREAREILLPALTAQNGFAPVTLTAVGHAHLDLAWLWPERETVRKGARTFSTALRMMERYPEYSFGASQAILYQWIKDRYPGLYAQIKQKITEGRWDIQGAMWVESDTNLSCGEALIRQILYGKAFFFEEFGKDIRVLWLPDAFGYTAALPQIMKKCGVPYFFTNKLSMNANRLPHHTFHWQGIDGSKVLVHMTPADDYASKVMPSQLKYTQDSYRDADVSGEALLLFGRSDGGGGAGREHLERLIRLKNMDQLPPVKTGRVQEFFEQLEKNADHFATWSGELYFENHQGTYTTQAKVKQQNRRAETAVRNCEILCTIAEREAGVPYPKDDLERLWKRILFLQFHDILPGSAIKRVYDEAETEYEQILSELEQITRQAARSLNCASLNMTSLPFDGWIRKDGAWYRGTAAPFGSVVLDRTQETIDAFENEFLSVKFGEDGRIRSIYDKEARREILKEGTVGNDLTVYPDDADAWELPVGYRQKKRTAMQLFRREFLFDGPEAICRSEYRYGNSVLKQDMILQKGKREIRFVTEVDWRETGKMLRTGFDINVVGTEAVCGIQFGQLARPTHANTSWDQEKFEVCAPRYVDLSENGYGVAMISKEKFGYCVQNNRLDLCLLRSSSWPGKQADQGLHRFAYTLYPHTGNTQEGNVQKIAEQINRPPVFFGGENAYECFLSVEKQNVLVETVKRAEGGKGYVMRLYESGGKDTETTVFIKNMKRCALCDMLENPEKELAVRDEKVSVRFTPYEILTLRFE